jgi:hypothetical protein
MTPGDESDHARPAPRDARWDAPSAGLDGHQEPAGGRASTAVSMPNGGAQPANPALAHAAIICAALVWWGIALLGADPRRVSGHGLQTGLPPTYYAALASLAVGFAIATSRRRVQPAVLGCYVVALVVVLHATTAALWGQPRYAGTSDQLRLIDSVVGHGTVDVFQSWPGFFALIAWSSRATGVPAVDYATWAPLAFGLASVAAVLFALRGVTRDPRLQWTAVWLFVVANSVGVDHLTPQAFGFLLVEIVLGLVLRYGPVSTRGRRPTQWLDRMIDRIGAEARRGGPRAELAISPLPLNARAAAGLGALCSLAVITVDPLSPVVLILSLGALTLVTGRPPLWAVAGLVAAEAWWVGVGHDALSRHSGLVGIDLAGHGLAGTALSVDVPRAGILLTLALAGAGLVRRWRAGHADVAPLALVAAPALVLALQLSGDEAPLRAYLFALPWVAFLAAAACDATPVRASRRVAPVAMILAATAVFAAVAGLDLEIVRVALGVFAGLVAPGWLLLRATVGRRLGSGYAAALTVPMSLAICALSGTLLALAGVKLTALSLALVVCAVSLACLPVAIARGTALPPLAPRVPAMRRLRPTPRTALAGGLALAILGVAASTVHQIVRAGDAARASTPFVALTGELERTTPVAGGAAVRVAFTVVNSQPRAIRPRLEIAVASGAVPPLAQTLAIGPGGRASVRRDFVAPCGDAAVATLTRDGAPPRRSTLRIPCGG